MSLNPARIAKAASILAFLAACGANDAGTGKGSPKGPGDDPANPSDGTGGAGGGGWVDDPMDSGSPVDPDAGCAKTSLESNAIPPAVMFQLDLSGSMQCSPTQPGSCGTNAGTSSRWHILREALKDALESIPSQALVGAMHYPPFGFAPLFGCPTASVTDAPLAPLDEAHKTTIRSKLDALTPNGGTPTHQAMIDAYVELQKQQDVSKFIILATDGEANYCAGCNAFCIDDSPQMIQGVAEVLQKDNVRTFVIGVPGSEGFRDVLSEMAKAGGTAKPGCGANDCHFDMTTSPENFGDAIADVLGEISEQLLGCSYSIPTQDGSFDSGKVNVQLTEDGTTTDILRDPSKQDGWDYSADGKHIELFGPACDKAKETKQGRIDIIFGCPTVVK